MKRLLGLMAATALAAGALPAAAQASASDTPNSLFATAAASLGDNGGNATDKNWYDFDILANAVVALGLDGALKDDGPGGSGLDSATVFAPNDRAFQRLVADITNLRSRSFGPNIATANDSVGGLLSTSINPAFVPFVRWVSLGDGDKNDSNPLWYGRTIGASNGTIQVISGVLRPIDMDVLFPADD